jgi:hypothetical protein
MPTYTRLNDEVCFECGKTGDSHWILYAEGKCWHSQCYYKKHNITENRGKFFKRRKKDEIVRTPKKNNKRK